MADAVNTAGKQSIFSKVLGKNSSNAVSGSQQKSTPSWYAGMQSYMQQPSQAVWSNRSYSKFADEAYRRNVIAHRAVSMISKGAASVPLKVSERLNDGTLQPLDKAHPLTRLIAAPSLSLRGNGFFEHLYNYRLISGNAYIQAVSPVGEAPKELHLLRPDRVTILAGAGGCPTGYRYKVGKVEKEFAVNQLTGASRILHVKEFHPTDDWYGLSPVEAAAYSIDQHNQAAAWNQALLQNGARPSGALVVKVAENNGGHLSEEQYWRIKGQIDEQFSGAANAGRPLLLEGGLEWKEMSLSPRDMDFIDCKNSAARDIALAFGVPPQMLGIPGDNTYSNLAEARLALWEQTILPLASSTASALNNWLIPMFGEQYELNYDLEGVSALALKREKLWKRVGDADFLTDEEKRQMLGIN